MGVDLQLAALRHLPVPTLVLSPKRTAVFANAAATRLLGPRDIQGFSPDGLGCTAKRGEDAEPVEVDVIVANAEVAFGQCCYRVLVSVLRADGGWHYVLCFEKSPHWDRDSGQKYAPEAGERVETNGGDVLVPKDEVTPTSKIKNGLTARPKADNTSVQLKLAVFDSCDTAAFMLSEDEQFYLTNKKLRSLLGDVMGGPDGCDGEKLRGKLEIWDEHFSRRLAHTELPGMRLVRSPRTPFQDYRCGFTHQVTGDRVVMNVSGECLYDDATGEFVGGICWCRDMQEYSDFVAQQQQRNLESHETICNFMPHMVWTTTPDGMCDWFSERWYNFTGLTPEESLGAGYAHAIHTDDLPILLNSWDIHNKAGAECSSEARYRRADGVYRWMLVRAAPCKDSSGKILKWYGTSTEIHELVINRIVNRRKADQVFTILAHAEVNLFAINRERKITMSEGGMIWETDGKTHPTAEFVGKNAIEVARNTQKGGIPEYEKNLQDILAGKIGMSSSEDLVGNNIYRTRMVAELEHDLLDGAQKPEVKGVLGLSIDITDMKQRAALEMDNTRLMVEEQAAKDSNRLKSQFLANMSHELRTPTAGVIGMVDLLGDDPTLSKDQREYVDSIQLSAKALLTIVNDILDFSKIESGRLDIEEVPFSLSTIIGELCKLLTMFAQQKGLDFVCEDTMDENLEVLGNPGRVRQVLSNLLMNALKFTKEGTVRIHVSSSVVESVAEDETIEVTFVIEDTGIGIEQSVLEKLFRPFSQGDSSTARLYGGTGLGLTISRNLADLMHGSIALESTPGTGSRATFKAPFKVSSWCQNHAFRTKFPSIPSLQFRHIPQDAFWKEPLAHRSINQDLLNQQISTSVTSYDHASKPFGSRASSMDAGNRVDLTPEQRRGTHVLVVEDNAINQAIALKTIRRLGFAVSAVWNGREALSYLASQPRPDIILVDVQMPVMDGYEATKLLREGDERLRGIPVVAMTASAIQGDREKCCEAGMDDYLAKPVEKGRLEEMLVRWAGRGRA
ncbi:Histidine protein kinase NIK1 [Lachnellula suecica]|uniref:histidine kinase n=1 Tax=Lachnellula suecica TaxID=602035 RepID=A0A8T9C604_9HELO|nr:Histidine protein kinase NIK1 [Lachnellula suecica]